MELKVKLYLTDEEGKKFMGRGVLMLLEEIERTGSLRQASISTGISYSKCYQMLSNAEEKLGLPLIERRKGGARHDGAVLTKFAHDFVDLWKGFQESVKEKAVDDWNKFLEDFSVIRKEDTNGPAL